MKSILHSLMRRFGDDPEQAAITGLNHILNSSAAARNGFQELLHEAGAILLHRFNPRRDETSERWQEIIGADDHGATRIVVRSPFWDPLTQQQLDASLKRLCPTAAPTAIVLIAPTASIPARWRELHDCAAQRCSLIPKPGPATSRPAAIAGTQHRLVLTSWRHVMEHLRQHAVRSAEAPTVIHDLELLLAHAIEIENHDFVPLHPDELGPDIPRRVMNLVKLVDDAVTAAVAQQWDGTYSLSFVPQQHGYGRYMSVRGADIWIGINFRRWLESGATPLWVQDWETKSWTPITLPDGAAYPAILDSVVAQLGDYPPTASNAD